MENEATTKTPIPIHRESLFWILSPVFCPTRPSCPACPRSTLVETPLQIALFFAKQTQCAQSQNAPKPLSRKALWKNYPPPAPAKQSQIKANFKRRNSSVVRKIAPYRTGFLRSLRSVEMTNGGRCRRRGGIDGHGNLLLIICRRQCTLSTIKENWPFRAEAVQNCHTLRRTRYETRF